MRKIMCNIFGHKFGVKHTHNAYYSELKQLGSLLSIVRICDRCGEMVGEHIHVRRDTQDVHGNKQ